MKRSRERRALNHSYDDSGTCFLLCCRDGVKRQFEGITQSSSRQTAYLYCEVKDSRSKKEPGGFSEGYLRRPRSSMLRFHRVLSRHRLSDTVTHTHKARLRIWYKYWSGHALKRFGTSCSSGILRPFVVPSLHAFSAVRFRCFLLLYQPLILWATGQYLAINLQFSVPSAGGPAQGSALAEGGWSECFTLFKTIFHCPWQRLLNSSRFCSFLSNLPPKHGGAGQPFTAGSCSRFLALWGGSLAFLHCDISILAFNRVNVAVFYSMWLIVTKR